MKVAIYHATYWFKEKKVSKRNYFNPFVPIAPFLYPPKISENLRVFFQGVEKGALGTNGLVVGKIFKLVAMIVETSEIEFLKCSITILF